MTKACRVIIALLLAGVAGPCFGHRLDEYLQSAKVSVERGRIGVDLTLTPGAAVVQDILKSIDADQDGVLSDAERSAYVDRVRNDLSMTVDAAPASLTVGPVSFPEVGQMRAGLGEIHVHLDAAVPAGGRVRHLVLENRHLKPISVYLVNCFVPSDPSVRIAQQDRSYDQSVYRVDYEQGDVPEVPPATSASGQSTSVSLFNGYVLHGVGHILTGYDHLLFVGALVLAARGLWELIKVVSAFTVAHTLTMALAAVGLVHVSARVVEPLIALSIVFVAAQNVFWPSRARGWGRLGAAFFFGLFHGLGFGGGLLEAMRELPSGAMLLSILAFSVGVEAGHQIVVLPLFALLAAARHAHRDVVRRATFSMSLQRFASAGISMAGVYYLWVALVPAP